MLSLRGKNRIWLAEIPHGDPNGAGKMNDPLFTAPLVVQALVGGVAAQMIGGMMAPDAPQGGGAAMPDTTAVKTPTPMPVAPGAASKAKAEKTLAQQMSMTRASTILSDDNTKLG